MTNPTHQQLLSALAAKIAEATRSARVSDLTPIARYTFSG
jgi:hypothetical protein